MLLQRPFPRPKMLTPCPALSRSCRSQPSSRPISLPIAGCRRRLLEAKVARVTSSRTFERRLTETTAKALPRPLGAQSNTEFGDVPKLPQGHTAQPSALRSGYTRGELEHTLSLIQPCLTHPSSSPPPTRTRSSSSTASPSHPATARMHGTYRPSAWSSYITVRTSFVLAEVNAQLTSNTL